MSIEPNENTNTPQRLPVFSTIFGAYGLIMDKFKNFVFTGTAFAVVLMFLYIFSGQASFCYNKIYRSAHFCTDNIVLFAVSHLVGIFILCIFIRSWAQNILAEKPQEKLFFIPQTADFKIIGGFLLYFLSLALAGVSFYLLIVREPNPNWKIEWAYFTFVSLGFFAPLLALRFSVYFAFLALGEKLPSLTEVWRKTSGSGFALLGGIIFLLLVSLFLMQALLGGFMRAESVSLLSMLGSEYLANIAVIFIAACFINYCYLQKVYLFGKDEDGK